MGALTLSQRMRRQPRQAPRVNWNDPLTRGLIAVFVGSSSFEPVTGKQFVNSVAGNRSAGPLGLSVDGRLGQAKASIAGPSINAGSMFVVATTSDATSEQVIAEIGADGSFSAGVRGIRFNGGKVDTYYRNFTNITSPASYRTNVPVAIGTTYSGASTTLYVDGQLVVSGNTQSTTATADVFNIGGITGQSTQYFLRGGVPVAYAWNRVLSAAEMSMLYADPWRLLRAPAQVMPTQVAQNSYVLAASAGSFAMAGVDAGLRAARRLPGAAGNFAVGAVVAGLIASRRLPAATGALTLTAGAARFAVARRLSAATGAFAFTGLAASLTAKRRLVAGAGAFSLTAGGLQMVYTPAQGSTGPTYTLGAAPGSLTLIGAAAAIRFNRRLTAAPAALVLSGHAAGLRAARRLQADVASFAITGSAAVLKYGGKAGTIDVSKIPASRIVPFEGTGSRIVVFEGSGSRLRIEQMDVSVKLPTKVGDKWMVDRDPDEKSHYGADITQELIDRATTAVSVVLVLVGVAQLEDPDIQVVTGDAGARTYVVAFLGGIDADPPEGWKWVARVTCANKEQFDKTTWFNKVDT